MLKPLLAALLATLALAAPAPAPAQAPQLGPPQPGVAIFAGGCFWCMEGPFDKLDGVLSTTSGYTGGHVKNPTYEQVSRGGTGHAEVVRITYDPSKITYERLLHVFWRNVDPLTAGGQFCDMGDSYRSAIFFRGPEQERLARASKEQVAARFKAPIATEIVPAQAFYPAEDYHQDYYLKNPTRYQYYRWRCGRDERLKALWGAEAGH